MTGYILGVGDYLVLNRDNTEGDTAYVLNLHDETPEQPVKADVIHLSSDWKIYDGSEWIDFGQHIEVPTKVSQLENDVGYALSTDVISDFTSLELFNQTIGNLESIISGI